jgi:quercetin dioxygenase-like cupin family protein
VGRFAQTEPGKYDDRSTPFLRQQQCCWRPIPDNVAKGTAMTCTNLDDLPEKSPFPGWRGKFIRSAGMTFVYWDVPAGTVLPEHSHPHEQVAHTFEGEFEIIVDGIRQLLRPGSVSIIPPNAVHSGRAITDCRILDVFCPVREDYIQFE